jgi:hypothetical protein
MSNFIRLGDWTKNYYTKTIQLTKGIAHQHIPHLYVGGMTCFRWSFMDTTAAAHAEALASAIVVAVAKKSAWAVNCGGGLTFRLPCQYCHEGVNKAAHEKMPPANTEHHWPDPLPRHGQNPAERLPGGTTVPRHPGHLQRRQIVPVAGASLHQGRAETLGFPE